jgi:Tol biopolymer transport system component
MTRFALCAVAVIAASTVAAIGPPSPRLDFVASFAPESVSADGRYFVGNKDGDVVVHDAITRGDIRLTDLGGTGHHVGSMAISPDGRQVAVEWIDRTAPPRSSELRLIDVVSHAMTAVRLVIDGTRITAVQPAAWSPDQRLIAVKLTRADDSTDLGTVRTANGRVTRLAATDGGKSSYAVFSPDGRYLAYDRAAESHSSQRDVFVARVDGRGSAPVAATSENDLVSAWTADGRALLFTTATNRRSALSRVEIADGRAAARPHTIVADLEGYDRTIGLTRDDALLYFRRSGGSRAHIAVVDFATGTMLQTEKVVQTLDGDQKTPVWSSDGASLAWSAPSQRAGGLTAVTRVLQSGEEKELHPDISTGVLQGWTPGGDLLYIGSDRGNHPGIFQVDAQTGAATPIAVAVEGFFSNPTFSRDGRRIAFRHQTAAGGKISVVSFPAAPVRSLGTIAGLGYSALSPDGTRIAYTTRGATLHVVPVEGGTSRDVITLSAPETFSGFFQWLADSTRIVASTSGSATRGGVVISTSDSSVVNLDPDFPQTFHVHPDGHRVVFADRSTLGLEVWRLPGVSALMPPRSGGSRVTSSLAARGMFGSW